MSADDLDQILALQRSAMTRLLRSEAIVRGDLDRAIAEITEAAASVMGVRRASVWRIDPTRTRIDCLDLFDAREATHVRGAQLHAVDAPRYFEAALTERCIVADDARGDPVPASSAPATSSSTTSPPCSTRRSSFAASWWV